MKEYSLGIAISDDFVILIKKTKPELQKGLYNFFGGKLEPNETPIECMVREFEEETGVKTKQKLWRPLGQYFRPNDFKVHVFYAESEKFNNVTTTTEESVWKCPKRMFLHYTDIKLMSNCKTMFEFSQTSDYQKYACQLTIQFPEIEHPIGEL
jgi:8-oxo-dGTP pyrophosphatase MutT (NUDIX family)